MKQSSGLSKVLLFCLTGGCILQDFYMRSIRAMLEGMTEWVWDPERDF